MKAPATWTPAAVFAIRNVLRMSRQDFAKHLGVSPASVRNWERGQPLLGASQRLLDGAWRSLTEDQKRSFECRLSRATGTVVAHSSPPSVTTGSALLEVLGREADQLSTAIDRGSLSDDRLTQLEGTAHWLGVHVVRTAPALVLDETLTYLRTVRALMEERQSSRYLVRLERLASMLSTVVGEIAFNEGYFNLARKWYSTARHAASAAGDVHLADCALAGLAYLDTYSENPRGVVRLLEARLESQPSPTPRCGMALGVRRQGARCTGARD